MNAYESLIALLSIHYMKYIHVNMKYENEMRKMLSQCEK